MLWLLLGAAGSVAAAGVGITQPSHGTELLTTSGFYDPVDETVQVRGTVTGIAPGTLGDYHVLVNGFAASVAGGGGGVASFGVEVPVGPTPPPGMASWPAWVPYVSQFTDIEAINLPMLAELYHIPSRSVVARYRLVMIDKRWDDDMDMHAQGALGDSGAFELTERGIDALETVHTSSLPQPGLADFNDDLTADFEGTPRAVATDTNYGSVTKACIGVEHVPGLSATQDYALALLEAQAQLQQFEAAEDTCENGGASSLTHLLPGYGSLTDLALRASACVAKNTFCVREQPREDRFELCVSEVEGIGQTLTIGGVESVDLSLADNAILEALNELRDVEGEIDVTLKDLFIRWDVEHAGCSARPQQPIEEETRRNDATLAAWSSCPLLQADAASALHRADEHQPDEQLPLSYPVNQGMDPERLEVEAGMPPDPLFDLNPRDTDLGTDTCSQDFVSADVETLLERFYEAMGESLDATWEAGNPDTQQAQALDLLLSRFETGVFGDMSDVIIDRDIERIESGEDRLRGKYDSAAHLRPNHPVFGTKEFVYSPPSDFPCEGGAYPGGTACSDSRNFYDQEFDVSYSMTTGMFNQVIGERYTTARMYRSLEPTCDDLGLPAGCAPDNQPVLDGTSLASLHASLAALGTTAVAIEMRPTMVPFTWIHPDPVIPPGAGRGDVTYQLGQYQVDVIGDAVGPDGTNLWLSVIIDFFAPAIDLDVAPAEDANEIVAALGESVVWHHTIVKSQLAGCPLIPRTRLPAAYVPPPCEADLTIAVAGLVEPVLEQALLAMISGHPAPQMFDASGEAADEKAFQQTDKYQWGQVITFYGDLVD